MRTAAWARYHYNHPNVLANWAEQNGYEPNCTCRACDPNELLPRPDFLVQDSSDTDETDR